MTNPTHLQFPLAPVSSAAFDERRVAPREYFELNAALLRLFRDPAYEPPAFPQHAMELYRACRETPPPAGEIVDLVGRDLVLAGQVIRAADGAALGVVPGPRTLMEAVHRLGKRRAAEVALCASLEQQIFRSTFYTGPMQRLRKHSVFTAELLEIVESTTGAQSPESYLAGLLHDVGIAGIIQAMENANITPPIEKAWPSIWALHESASQYLASLWGFSDELAARLGLHHSLLLDGEDSPETLSLAIADMLAHEVGFGIHPAMVTSSAVQVAAARGLRPGDFRELRVRAQKLAESFCSN